MSFSQSQAVVLGNNSSGKEGPPVTNTKGLAILAGHSSMARSEVEFPGGIIGPLMSNPTTAPGAGLVRLSKNDSVTFRNESNSADVPALRKDNGDSVVVGGLAGVKIGPNSISLKGHLSRVEQVNLLPLDPGSCHEAKVELKGAEDGDSVALGVGSQAASERGLMFFGFVSSTNEVTIRYCNLSGERKTRNTSADIRVDTWKH